MQKSITIATRKSPLAIKQANEIKERLLSFHPDLNIELLGLSTTADEKLDINLTQIGGKGLFVKELEEALLDGRADIAVHSMKDMPMDLPPGLAIPCMTKRADARDAFVSNVYASLALLPAGAKIGTSSLRRQTQLRHHRPDLTFVPLRGNVQTRLNRLDQGEFAAIILATAGLVRLSLENRITEILPVSLSLPAAGQGALGVECRENDTAILALLNPIKDQATMQCVIAEREVCRILEGGCQVPIGAFATIVHSKISLKALITNKEGNVILTSDSTGDDPVIVGRHAGNDLLAQGARDILNEFK